WTGLDPDGDWSIDEAEWTPADFIKVEIIDKATDNDGNITFTVTNNPPPPPPTINITVVKVWRGIAVADLPTGTTVTVKLYNKDGLYDTQTLSGPGWTYTWTGLSESDGPWSLEEVCPAGFLQVGNVGKATDNGGNITFTVTNEPEPEPELIDITVIKEWDIPTHVMLPPQASVTVQLYNGDTPVGPIVTLNADNDWTHTWEGMDADGDWSARELTLPKRFLLDEITMEVDEDGNITFTIVNIPDGSWERTGEGAWIWILGGVLLLALIGLAVLIFLRKRGKKAAPAQEAESLESTESEE
ncbi:MAG: Cna B-type domain-containing protein, partial [Clostridiales bacterium]|nr:Cna B-type domain-containing protein [Clostridiales bacterium]